MRKTSSKCKECRGKGYMYVGEAITGRGPDDVFPEKERCDDCDGTGLAPSPAGAAPEACCCPDSGPSMSCATHGVYGTGKQPASPPPAEKVRRYVVIGKNASSALIDIGGASLDLRLEHRVIHETDYDALLARCEVAEREVAQLREEVASERIAFWEKDSDQRKAIENRDARLAALTNRLTEVEQMRSVWENQAREMEAECDRLREALKSWEHPKVWIDYERRWVPCACVLCAERDAALSPSPSEREGA